jgi:rhomboid family GlyGly-CTERM serine protease
MNADIPAKGLAGVLQSLNGDRGYGVALLCACLLLLIPELGGENTRLALRFDREAVGLGEGWRLLTAHFVHLDLEHALLNCLGLLLMWALFARDFSPWCWLAIYCMAALAVGLGLLWFSAEVAWYVGASGALHGVMCAGTMAHLRRGDLDGWILVVFIGAKLLYEQVAGSLPFAGGDATVVDAHLYGAVGGTVMALFVRSRAQPL